ncbi:MAG TPA: MYXO-CTERM sorting domain-containing protein [Polyangiaceae bacterium]|nr:MYXO-CTERM sorting domain-containing protein [Polyangiaceae bacterium]
MRSVYFFGLPLVALFVAAPAQATDWYVAPGATATSGCPTRATPCSLASAASGAVAGDTVYLTSGSYQESIYVANSGTADAPITFKADECSTPIIESLTSVDANQTTGVHSETGEYLVFEGLVVRGWSTGMGNRWAGGTDSDEVSNGHWTIKHCISYSNGRTGFTFFSGPSYTLINSISAHNGTSTEHAWSSGVTMYETTGTNLVQGVVSFENTDEQKHTDGSGFIVDERANGVTFINNLAFGNSGSCLRLTRSSGTIFVNNTCYHNSQFGSQATYPTNPGEIYFSSAGVTIENINFRNNVVVATGIAPAGSKAIEESQPTAGWTSNAVSVGATTLFTAPEGATPDFTLPASATALIGKGTADPALPTTDIGFDPKCLVKRTPKMFGMVAPLSRWQYDIDIDYVTMKGGVAKCFNPGPRSNTAPDIGAYKSGAVTTAASCTPPAVGSGVSSGGAASGAGAANAGAGISLSGSGGAGTATGTAGAAASRAGAGNVAPPVAGSGNDASGCSCRTAGSRGSHLPAALGLFGLAAVGLLRRRRDRA